MILQFVGLLFPCSTVEGHLAERTFEALRRVVVHPFCLMDKFLTTPAHILASNMCIFFVPTLSWFFLLPICPFPLYLPFDMTHLCIYLSMDVYSLSFGINASYILMVPFKIAILVKAQPTVLFSPPCIEPTAYLSVPSECILLHVPISAFPFLTRFPLPPLYFYFIFFPS